MANTNIPKSFNVESFDKRLVVRAACANTLAAKGGQNGGQDIVIINSSGKAAPYGSGILYGLAWGSILDKNTLDVKATAADGDFLNVITDPNAVFSGQLSSYALTDPYTTAPTAATYDVAGSAGAQYVDAAASSNDHIKVVTVDTELKEGSYSATGNYAKAKFRFNPVKHFQGPQA